MKFADAQSELYHLIMKGNPGYYIWQYVEKLSADDLAAELYDWLGEEVTVEDED